MKSGNLTEINMLITQSDSLYASIEKESATLYSAFVFIEILCILNFSFLFQHFVTFIFTKRMGRFYEFPSILHLTDLILAISSGIIIDWFTTNIQSNVNSDPNIS